MTPPVNTIALLARESHDALHATGQPDQRARLRATGGRYALRQRQHHSRQPLDAPRVAVQLAFIAGKPLQGPGTTPFDVLGDRPVKTVR